MVTPDTPAASSSPPPTTLRPPKAKLTQTQIEKEHDSELDAAAEDEGKKERSAKAERILPESIREMRRGENQELVDYLQQIRGSASIQIAIHRLKPQLFKGKNIKGHIENVEEPISEDELRDRYGGGQYQLKVKRRNDQGSWVFMTSTVVDIAGDPRIDNLAGNVDESSGHNSAASIAGIHADAETKVAMASLSMMERQLEQMRTQHANSGMDAKMLEQLMKPMELQVKMMQEQMSQKDKQFAEQMNKPADPFQQKLLEKFVDGDQARVNALRAQYESEIRAIKEGHSQDIKRLEDRHDRLLSEVKRDHERQMDMQKNGYERELASIKALHAQMDVAATSSTAIIKSSLDRDLARLEREVADLKSENKSLREKKDKSVMDMVKEVNQFKEELGVEAEGGDKSALERVVDTIVQSDQIMGIAGKWLSKEPANAAPAPRAPQQQLQQAPPRYVRDKRTGQVGEWNPAKQRYEEVPQRRQKAGPGAPVEDLQIPPEHLQAAITILERSYANKVPPKNFAATISTALPAEIFQAIRDHGVDGFVNKVAKLGASSPLRRQDGINWLREVGKVLIGDDSPPTQQDDDVDLDDDALNDAPDDDLTT